jgi:5-methyltetrahydropteroyltriglutamate--homocysteine methyltransferase
MGIRNDRYKAMVPQVVATLALKGRVHAAEARFLRAHTKKKIKFTLPGPMTIVDTVADRFYGDRVKMAFAFAELLNQEALALQADGVDIVQFDEPAFNVYMQDAADWGVKALERAALGLHEAGAASGRACTTAVHICYGYGIQANIDWKKTLGDEWRQYEQILPALAASSIDQVSLECIHSHVPAELMALLKGKDVMVGVIDVASDAIETPEEVADTIERALRYVPAERLIACTNCGLAPMAREVAEAKLVALAKGAALARQRHAGR